jgi:hypothetical protein
MNRYAPLGVMIGNGQWRLCPRTSDRRLLHVDYRAGCTSSTQSRPTRCRGTISSDRFR